MADPTLSPSQVDDQGRPLPAGFTNTRLQPVAPIGSTGGLGAPNAPTTGDTTLGQGPAQPVISDIIARTYGTSAPNNGIVVAPAPSGSIAERWQDQEGGQTPANLSRLGIQNAMFAEKQHMDAANELLRQHQEARSTAEGAVRLAMELSRLQHETRQQNATAALAMEAQHLDPLHPDYEKNEAAVLAKHALVNPNAANEILSHSRNTRQRYMEAMAKGGRDEFFGPSQHKFDEVMSNGGTIFQAQGAARAIEGKEQKVREAIARGDLQHSDFYPDANDSESWKKSPLWETDATGAHTGYRDYDAALSLAASNAGKRSGSAEDRLIVNKFAGKADADLTPDEQTLRSAATARLARIEQQRPGAAPVAKPRGAGEYIP